MHRIDRWHSNDETTPRFEDSKTFINDFLRMQAVLQHLGTKHKIERRIFHGHIFRIARNINEWRIHQIHRAVGLALVLEQRIVRTVLRSNIQHFSDGGLVPEKRLHSCSTIAQYQVIGAPNRRI